MSAIRTLSVIPVNCSVLILTCGQSSTSIFHWKQARRPPYTRELFNNLIVPCFLPFAAFLRGTRSSVTMSCLGCCEYITMSGMVCFHYSRKHHLPVQVYIYFQSLRPIQYRESVLVFSCSFLPWSHGLVYLYQFFLLPSILHIILPKYTWFIVFRMCR